MRISQGYKTYHNSPALQTLHTASHNLRLVLAQQAHQEDD